MLHTLKRKPITEIFSVLKKNARAITTDTIIGSAGDEIVFSHYVYKSRKFVVCERNSKLELITFGHKTNPITVYTNPIFKN